MKRVELGPEHSFTLQVVTDLGNILSNQNKMEESKKMLNKALRISEKTLGKEKVKIAEDVKNNR